MTPIKSEDAVGRFGAAIAALDQALDWPRLGLAYCDEGGLEFFTEEQRAANLDAGLMFATDLGELLEPGGRSLYVGAGIAELVPICFEVLVLDREVTVASLPGFEVDELNRALAEVEAELAVTLPRLLGTPLGSLAAERSGFDHAWVVSVLTDPDAFPALHDKLYERRLESEGATGRGSLAEDREHAKALIDDVLARLADGALLTTSDEEWSLFGPALAERGLAADFLPRGRLSVIVGDVVRHARTARSEPAPAPKPPGPWGSGSSKGQHGS